MLGDLMCRVCKGVGQGCCLGEQLNELGIGVRFHHWILLRSICLLGMISGDCSSLEAGFLLFLRVVLDAILYQKPGWRLEILLCNTGDPWFENRIYIWRGLQILKLLITQFSPSSCYFCRVQVFLAVPSSGTFSVCVLLLKWQIKFHTRANSRQNYNFVHRSLVLFFSRDTLPTFFVAVLSCILLTKHIIRSAFTYRPAFLLANNNAYVFFFIVFMFSFSDWTW